MSVFSNLLSLLDRTSKKEANSSSVASDILPYACHYATETILTKNGELLQVLKLEDFHSDRDVRSDIRTSILSNIKGLDYAVTIHTIRRKKSVTIPWSAEHQNTFSYELHKSCYEHSKQKIEYVSEIYITVIARGMKSKFTPINFLANFSFAYIKNKFGKYLRKQHHELSLITEKIADDLKYFNAQKLCINKNNDSELLQFFRLLITLLSDNETAKPSYQDISDFLLTNYNSVFGFNALEIRHNSEKRFGAVLGVKRYREVNYHKLSMAILLNKEFVISEAIDFDHEVKQHKHIKHQNYLLDISKDQKLKEVMNVSDSSVQDRYINHCINVLAIGESVNELESCISEIISAFSSCGIVIFRHDISMEEAFFRILPANFSFKALSYYTNCNNMAGFALLHMLDAGSITCPQWGYAIVLFWSIYDTPYFFNFHVGDKSHTAILGPVNSGKTILQNFVISESKKIGTKVLIIEHQLKSCIFVHALNGIYKRICDDDINVCCNPFHVQDTVENREFLRTLIQNMTDVKQDQKLVITVVDKIFSLPIESRTNENLNEIISPLGKNDLFGEKGRYKALLDNDHESQFWKNESIGFNFGGVKDHQLMLSLVSMILNKIESILDGSPCILVLEEAWKISDVFVNSKMLDSFLSRMKDLNCVIIFTSGDIDASISNKFTTYLNKIITNQIFLPGNVVNKNHMKAFNLTKEDRLMISNLQGHNRHFCIKQGDKSVVLRLDISSLKEAYVLSSNAKNILYMEEAMKEVNTRDANIWLPVFYNKVER